VVHDGLPKRQPGRLRHVRPVVARGL
jgi:hypothetical protein